MAPWWRITLLGCGAVLLFDAVASLASRATGIAYGWASVGSFALYFWVGFAVARATADASLSNSLLAGAALGATDATVGLLISWLLGPGRDAGPLTLNRWITLVTVVVLTALAFAAVGGLFGRSARSAV